jgi:hypothetical protein
LFNGGPVLLHEFANPALGSLPARWRGLTWCLRHPPSWTRALTRRGSQPTHRVFPNVAALVSTDSPVSRPPRPQAPVRPQLDSRDQARRLPADGPSRPCGHPADHPQGQRLDEPLPVRGRGREPPQGPVLPDRLRGGVATKGSETSFQLLRHRRYAFDLLELNGTDLRGNRLRCVRPRWRASFAKADRVCA